MHRTSVVIDFAGQLKGLQAYSMAYSDLSVAGNADEAAEGLFRALRWAERQPSAQRLLIAGACKLFVSFYLPGLLLFAGGTRQFQHCSCSTVGGCEARHRWLLTTQQLLPHLKRIGGARRSIG